MDTTDTKPAPLAPTVKLLTQEERNDLRKFVLGGGQLDLEQSKAVIETIRQGRGAAAMANENKPKKSRSKKPQLSDAELNAQLDSKFDF